MKFFKTKYRIVSDKYKGFEAQYKLWWFPFWFKCFGNNTNWAIENAVEVCKKHKKYKQSDIFIID